jgi:hypothetical protein
VIPSPSPSGDALHGRGFLLRPAVARMIRAVYCAGTTALAPPSKTTTKPAFSVAAGTYVAPQALSITNATPGVEIFVTVNGRAAIPVGQGYYGPISITGSATIQAVAVAPGYLPSDSVSAAYTITSRRRRSSPPSPVTAHPPPLEAAGRRPAPD